MYRKKIPFIKLMVSMCTYNILRVTINVTYILFEGQRNVMGYNMNDLSWLLLNLTKVDRCVSVCV